MRHICNMDCLGFGANPRNRIADRLDGVGWGLFFLWVGASLILDLGWGLGLLGVGVLTLAMQGVRRVFGLELEGFWVLVGGGFTVAGILDLGEIDVALLPILLIAFGVYVLVSVFRKTRT